MTRFDFSHPPFDLLSDSERQRLEAAADIVFFAEDTEIMAPGRAVDTLFIVIKGMVREVGDDELIAVFRERDTFDARALVYPKPAATIPLPASTTRNGTGAISGMGDEDFAGLRSYAAGDTPQRIAWKAFAREQGLQVKQFSALQGSELWLDWNLAPSEDPEQKLAILARWVLDSEVQGLLYGLRLPGIELPLDRGAAHRDECLRALALFGLDSKNT